MKILIIAPRLPYPPDKGDKLTIYNYLKFLSKHHDVSLITFYRGTDKIHVDKINKHCHLYTPVRHSYVDVAKNCMNTILGRQSFQQSYYGGNRHMQAAVLEQIRIDPPDVIYCHTLRMADYVRSINTIPKILALQISFALNYRRLKMYTSNILEKVFYSLEYHLIKHYEYLICSHFKKILLISRKDLLEIEANAGRRLLNVEFLPHGVDHVYFKPSADIQEKNGTIVMTGNMGYPPNEDAALFFHNDIFPLVKRKMPEAVLYLVGKNPSKKVRELDDGKDVIVTGAVEDIRPYLQMATVVIVPTRIAAGMQNKLVEAMAMKKAIVATSNANEGIGAKDGDEVLIADTPEDFSGHIAQLMLDTERRTQIEENARAFIETKFTWEYFLVKLETIMQSLAGERP